MQDSLFDEPKKSGIVALMLLKTVSDASHCENLYILFKKDLHTTSSHSATLSVLLCS